MVLLKLLMTFLRILMTSLGIQIAFLRILMAFLRILVNAKIVLKRPQLMQNCFKTCKINYILHNPINSFTNFNAYYYSSWCTIYFTITNTNSSAYSFSERFIILVKFITIKMNYCCFDNCGWFNASDSWNCSMY